MATSRMVSSDMSLASEHVQLLLQCAVCLERFKQPKLLPCQHTFCLTPCLEGLVDRRTRSIRCPECRADHFVPHNGTASFPNNLTIIGFLELSGAAGRAIESISRNEVSEVRASREFIQPQRATSPQFVPQDAAGAESGGCYICHNEGRITRCCHCDQLVCEDCCRTHMEQVRADVTRMINQVRHGFPQLTDYIIAFGRKGTQLQSNCERVKVEISEALERHIRELKARERTLREDVDTFFTGELRNIRTHQENAEVEIASLASFCDSAEFVLSMSRPIPDGDLVEMKDQCQEHLETVHCYEDGTIRPPAVKQIQASLESTFLSSTISNFGELIITSRVAPAQSQAVSDNTLQRVELMEREHTFVPPLTEHNNSRSGNALHADMRSSSISTGALHAEMRSSSISPGALHAEMRSSSISPGASRRQLSPFMAVRTSQDFAMEVQDKPARGKKKTTRGRKKKDDEVNDEKEDDAKNDEEQKETGSSRKGKRVTKVAVRRRSQKAAVNKRATKKSKSDGNVSDGSLASFLSIGSDDDEEEGSALSSWKKKEEERQKEMEKKQKEEAESHSDKERKKQEKLEQKKQEKLEQKKKEKKEQISLSLAENTLIQMDTKIKKALNIESLDIDKCVAILEDLAAIPVNPLLLRKNLAIMATIKKCRKFKKSIAIRQKAEVIYRKFKSFFLAEGAGKLLEPKSKLKQNKENEMSGDGGSNNNSIITGTPTASNAAGDINGAASDSNSVTPSAASADQSEGISAGSNGLTENSTPTNLASNSADLSKVTDNATNPPADLAVPGLSTNSTINPAASTTKSPSSPSHLDSSVEGVSGDHVVGSTSDDTPNSSGPDTSLSSQKVDDSFIFQKGNVGTAVAASAIPGLDAIFKEGVDFRSIQTSNSDMSAGGVGSNLLASEQDSEAVKSVSDSSGSSLQKDKGNTRESISYDPRRLLSRPLPPTVGDEDMEEYMEDSSIITGDKVDGMDVGVAESSSPIIPVVGSGVGADLTDMVSDAVR